MIKILHTADWHIGNYNNGPDINGTNGRFIDICKCIDFLCETAEREKPDIIIFSGDMFHQAKVWADRGLKESQTAVKYLRRLEKTAPIAVMRGTPNHDSEEQFNALKSVFEGDDSVHIITEPGIYKIHAYDGKTVQIAALPGFDRGYYRANHPGLSKEEENEVFTTELEKLIIGMKASCSADFPAILMSHYTIVGCNMESGQTALFSQFEPVVYPHSLIAADYDLVCFGHIHRPQQIEGCKNTFYSGAVSGLNFNDEGQKRGFYIHEMDESTKNVQSRFFETPSREFVTLYFQDGDISDFNEKGEMLILKGFENKIVRVLYNCTDEHNKAFNKTLLERQLYKDGAYFVQEITPQKITITVNKNGLEGDNTPEENLTSYLEEKEITPQRLGEIIELSRPIISEAMENNAAEKKTGIFLPVEIEVHNYRNYRDEVFSYDNIQFCTINGSNGVGKSSLFMDAMIDCLYEETREGDLTGWICNDEAARSGSIKFTFKLGEKTYRVTRTRAKSGKATLNLSEFIEGEWVDRSCERYRDTQAEIENTIGMDSLTLKACALIMQDQYGLFLQADKEARMNILGSILGLKIYDDMERISGDRLTEANRQIRQLTDKAADKAASLPNKEELLQSISDAETDIEKRQKAISIRTAETDTLRVKLNTQLEAAGRVIRLEGKIQTLTANKASKEAIKTSQKGIIHQAESVLQQEAAISAGVAEYFALLEQEKTIISNKGMFDTLTEQIKQLERDIEQAQTEAQEASKKKATITLMKIGPLSQALEREAELKKAHSDYEATAAKISEMESYAEEYSAQRDAIISTEKKLERFESDYKEAHARLTARVESLKNKIELLNDSGCPDVEKASCKFLADAIEAKKMLPEAEAAIVSLDNEYAGGRQQLSDELSAAQKALVNSLYNPSELAALKGILSGLEAQDKEYHNLEAVREELELMQERSVELDAKIATANNKAESGKKARAELREKLALVSFDEVSYNDLLRRIEKAKEWQDKERILPVAREKKQAAEMRISELDIEISALETEISETFAELETEKKAAYGSEEMKAKVSEIDTEIKQMQSELQTASMSLGALKKQLENAEKSLCEISEIKHETEQLGVLAAGYEELKRAFSQDGIPHNIIRSIIPIFEATATNILGQMSGGKMSVEFITEKVLKSNSKKEVTTLDIVINDCDTGRLPYMSRSGGERVKAALSVILALSEIKSSKAGVQLGFLFIDEPPFLDAPGVQAYCDALEAIQKRYNDLKVMAITHDPAMKSRFPQSVDVVKTPEGSKVVYN